MIDTVSLRQRLGLTRAALARAYGLDADKVKRWESGREAPSRAAAVLLTLIEREPAVIAEILKNGGKS